MFVSEYDAFGPWIYEITEGHPLPRLFAPYVRDGEAPLMLFKIPRDIERRRATPDMDLYDFVVGAYEDRVRILRRTGRSVEDLSVPYRDIEGIRLFRHLLLGRLTLYLRSGEAVIPFNTVSMDIITRFLGLVRARYQTGPASAGAAEIGALEHTPENMDILFVNLLRDLRNGGEGVRLCAFQPATALWPKDSSAVQRLAFRLQPRKLPASVHLLGPSELIVIQREAPAKKSQGSAYSYTFIYLPLSGIRGIGLAESGAYQDVTDCVLQLDRHPVSFAIRRENQAALDFYQALAALP